MINKDLIVNVQRLRKEGKSFGEISKQLLITKSQACYANKISLDKYDAKQSSQYQYIKNVCELAKRCTSICQILKILGKQRTNTCYKHIEKILLENNVDTSHFVKHSILPPNINNKKETIEYLCENSTINSDNLKKRLFREGYKDYKCESCGLTEWMGKPIPLQIHHINGHHYDNRISNLQILCPNCHSLTDNFCRNKNKHKKENKQEIKKNRNSQSKIVSKETLIEDFKELGSFRAVGKKYHITDNAIRKWCEKYDLPSHALQMRDYIRSLYGTIKWDFTKGNKDALLKYSRSKKQS